MLRETRLWVIHAVLVAFAAALVGRSAYVQLWQGAQWDRLAAQQQFAQSALPAPRGAILDVTGLPLAESHASVRLAIAPPEVREPRQLSYALQHLHVDAATIRRALDRKRKWVEVNATFLPSDVTVVRAIRGVHVTEVRKRIYLPSDGVRRIIGRTDDSDIGRDGIELALDSLLRGERGSARALVGARGERYESPTMLTEPPRPGHSVTLTISYALQDICDRALQDATARLGATGGDIVVLDPRSGEVRCLASRRVGLPPTAITALTEPYEPGSTLKPFFVGRLLESGKATVDETIDTFHGVYTVHGRTIRDVHKADVLSLADVVRFSSNVGIARFTERLTDREMYDVLRDAGFGTPTGVQYPSEASGTLRDPTYWSLQSHASLAIGYELAVTPLQLAAAYAAIANGGVLLQPALIKTIRDADGDVLYEHKARPVRRILEPATARTLRGILATVVDSGTATEASLSSYELGGKSGTARRVSHGSYNAGNYTATFVGLFPATDPLYVVLVKLDSPQVSYYGGKAAAPVARAVIEAAIASRNASLDRSRLAEQKTPSTPSPARTGNRIASAAGRLPADADASSAAELPVLAEADTDGARTADEPVRFDLDAPRGDTGTAPASLVAVPDVHNLPLRVAVRTLHHAGFRVQVAGAGDGSTMPPAGSEARPGSLVRLARRAP